MPGGTVTAVETVVSGTQRYKFFKRPIMPRVNAYPPQYLLAASAAGTNNPLLPDDVPVEAPTRDMGIQTMYRESEAQTNPYTPNYIVPPGQEPEVLLLKNLTYENGLPMSEKEMSMIEFARSKKNMEMNLPPFTDEACLTLRKRLMEQQEMMEYHLREEEIDKKRNERINALEEALQDREESNAFLCAQRLETIRLLRLEERESVLQKIRHQRIKTLRRLAHQRNLSDPVLSGSATGSQRGRGGNGDIIDLFYDRGSSLYAPIKREGKELGHDLAVYDISSRTAPLTQMANLLSLEYTMPRSLLHTNNTTTNDTNESGGGNNLGSNIGGGTGGLKHHISTLASQTMPLLLQQARRNNHNAHNTSNTNPANQLKDAFFKQKESQLKAAEYRMTSATARQSRQTKRDIEEMHQILSMKKHATTSGVIGSGGNNNNNNLSSPIRSATKRAESANNNNNNNSPATRPFSATTDPSSNSPSNNNNILPSSSLIGAGNNNNRQSAALSALLAKKPKARPPTPDITDHRPVAEHLILQTSGATSNNGILHLHHSSHHAPHHTHHTHKVVGGPNATTTNNNNPTGNTGTTSRLSKATMTQLALLLQGTTPTTTGVPPTTTTSGNTNHPLHIDDDEFYFLQSITLLQRLIRGRAVQNIMFEGRYRRRELIAELQAADTAELEYQQFQLQQRSSMMTPPGVGSTAGGGGGGGGGNGVMTVEEIEKKLQREQVIKDSSFDSVGGAITSQLLHTLAVEKQRMEQMETLQSYAYQLVEERRRLEMIEAGRRQREGMEYPLQDKAMIIGDSSSIQIVDVPKSTIQMPGAASISAGGEGNIDIPTEQQQQQNDEE
jgi:hypothetical protein